MHAHVTISASLTWNLVDVSVHWECRDEYGEPCEAGGTRLAPHLQETPEVGEEINELLVEVARALPELAAARRGSRHQPGV